MTAFEATISMLGLVFVALALVYIASASLLKAFDSDDEVRGGHIAYAVLAMGIASGAWLMPVLTQGTRTEVVHEVGFTYVTPIEMPLFLVPMSVAMLVAVPMYLMACAIRRVRNAIWTTLNNRHQISMDAVRNPHRYDEELREIRRGAFG